MIRKAEMADLEKVVCLYEELHDAQEAGKICTNWIRGDLFPHLLIHNQQIIRITI